ncbi:hypothetical protein D1872_88270 [compost metagenome]
MTQLNPVEQKMVPFNGAELLGVKANNEKVYVGVRWVCEGIGLSRGQANNEVSKVQTDIVLKQGARNFVLQKMEFGHGSTHEVLTIELDYLPLWLAKISITPNMQVNQPEVADKLVQYQMKAKDVLAEAFLPKDKPPMTQSELIAYLAQQNVEREKAEAEHKKRLETVEKRLDDTAEILALNPTEWRKKVRSLLNKIAQKRGGHDAYSEVNSESYELLEQRGNCKLGIRQENIKKRMALEGAAKSKINAISKLEAIAEDSRLTEIYLAIVKEMAIKYSVKVD